jgi:hypothetical protein
MRRNGEHHSLDYGRVRQVLLILQQNNYNFKKTSRDTKVPRTTIYRWVDKFTESIPFSETDSEYIKELKKEPQKKEVLIPTYDIPEEIIRIDGEQLSKFIADSFKLKEELLGKMLSSVMTYEKIPISEFLKFAQALKLVHDISKEELPQMPSVTNNFLQIVTQELEKNLKLKDEQTNG